MRLPVLFVLALSLASASARAVPSGPVTLDSLQLGPFAGTPEQQARTAIARLGAQLGQLSRNSSLVLEKSSPLPQGGHVVRFRQYHQGQPVLDAVVAVRLDEAGRAVRVSSSAVPLNDVALRPKISDREAIRIARQAVPTALPAEEIGSAIRIVVPTDGGRLAWQVFVPTLIPVHAIFVIVDAETGEVLSLRDKARTAADEGKGHLFPSGKVAFEARQSDGSFRTNPSPLVTEELPGLGEKGQGKHLVGNEVLGYNCCPTKDCDGTTPPPTFSGSVPLGIITLPFTTVMCDEKPVAVGDENGNFLFAPPKEPHAVDNGSGLPASEPAVPAASDGDTFAEVMGYRYAQGALDYMKSLDPAFQLVDKARPLRVTANFLFPNLGEIDPNQVLAQRKVEIKTLTRFDNAAYVPAGSAEQLGAAIPGYSRDFDSLILFQGTSSDFAYDPDVITHEMGHGIVEATARLADYSADEQGIVDAPGAMNEGIADYWAAARENDPKVGEYVGDLSGTGEGALRSVENDLSCPSVISGEVHQDSQHFSGALWNARKAVAATDADRKTFDQAVLAALRQMQPNSSFEQAAGIIAGEVGKSFDAAAKTKVDAAFAAKKVTGCERVVDLAPAVGKSNVTIAPADKARNWKPYAPGPIQFRIQLPKGANGLKLTVQGSPGNNLGLPGLPSTGGNNANLKALVKSGEAIKFTYKTTGITDDSTANASFGRTGQGIYQVTVPLDATCGEQPAFLALANTNATGQWFVQQLDVEFTVDETKKEECQALEPDAGADAGTDSGGGADAESGCGCSGGAPASMLALGALGAFLRRKRG